jgi:hypothetical protein
LIAALRLQSLARSSVAITMIMMPAASMVMTGMVSGEPFGLDRQGLTAH